MFFYGDTPEFSGATPARDGYAFVGWFTAADGGVPLTDETVVTGKMAFYAHWRQIRFLDGDVACADGSVVLTSAQVDWLNGFGDYETVKASVAAMGAEEFEGAYLLNLDLTDGGRAYTFDVTGCDATGENVVVAVRLVRTGSVQKSGGGNAPINGVLRLYGSATPAKNGFSLLTDAVISDTTFASGETAMLTLPKSGGNRFFRAVITAP